MRRWVLVAAVGVVAFTARSAPGKDSVLSIVEDRDLLQEVPFPRVIALTTGHRVQPVDARKNARLLRQLGIALDATLRTLNEPTHPIHAAGRVNEASRFVEDEIRRQLNGCPGWKCGVPLTAEGREQRSGYPDLRVVTDAGVIFYLDPKLYARGSRGSSLRTFYYEPKTLTGKIHDDAMHLLVGIEHDGTDARSLCLRRWELVDLSRLKMQLKAEFQASNREVYSEVSVISRSKPTKRDQ